MRDASADHRSGLLFGLACYALWGFLPVYWKQLLHVPATEILAHRMVWSLGFVVALLVARRRWAWIRTLTARTVGLYTVAALLLALNWGLYIWAVNSGFVVETALGYFMNPLLNVAFGAMFLSERLRRAQWIAVGLAACGVAYLTIVYGRPPWISLTLAVSFAIYALLKKKASLGAIEGLGLETAVLFLPALAYLLWLTNSFGGHFGEGARTTTLLAGSGLATALPLVLFAAAVRRLTLTVVGLIQYLAPTLQFLLGVFVYDEPFTPTRLVGFLFIWGGLAVYSAEGLYFRRRRAV